MSKIRVELNSAGIQELLKSPEMQAILQNEANKKVTAAGEGYAAQVHTGQKRAYANIYPETDEARYDNYDNNTLEVVIRA